jgi:D-alanyl-D-alanine carboxypeptidase/D-alanyl-D-alanine-endopeptidase (penicillin-binding protein 4)
LDLPQKPVWVDGCGLSRYNLFTPQDFVMILNKMRTEFGMNRMKNILATGGEGTISSYYKAEAGRIFAKTGTLSGVVALSGYLYTSHNRLLIFSVLVNNHAGSATAVRRAVERFVEGLGSFDKSKFKSKNSKKSKAQVPYCCLTAKSERRDGH